MESRCQKRLVLSGINMMSAMLPSGKHTNNYNYGKIQHFVAGKIHDFDWAMFNSYVNVYQRLTREAKQAGFLKYFSMRFLQPSSYVSKISFELLVHRRSRSLQRSVCYIASCMNDVHNFYPKQSNTCTMPVGKLVNITRLTMAYSLW